MTIDEKTLCQMHADANKMYMYQWCEKYRALLSASIADTAGAHPDDVAVDKFAQAMKEKMAAARVKGRGGWETCPPEMLSRMLREHVEKGDPRDVANFCMMLWALQERIAATPASSVADAARASEVHIATVYEDNDGTKHVQLDVENFDDLPVGMKLYARYENGL